MTTETLDRLETYYDAVPRGGADVEDLGPFTLFVARSGGPTTRGPVSAGIGRRPPTTYGVCSTDNASSTSPSHSNGSPR